MVSVTTNKVLLLIILIFILYLAITGRLDDVWDAITGNSKNVEKASAKKPGQMVLI